MTAQQTWRPGWLGPAAAAERKHFEDGDGQVVHDGDLHPQVANQLQRPQAGHMLVATQPALEQLFVLEQKDGPLAARNAGRHPEPPRLGPGKKAKG